MKIKELEKNKALLQDKLTQILPDLVIKNIQPEAKIGNARADFLIIAMLKGKKYTFVCELKSLGSPSHVSSAITQLKKILGYTKAYPILIAPYISLRSAEICRQNDIGFIDLEGNVFLSTGDVLIDKRLKERINIEKREVSEIFSPRATRIIRVLLESEKERWLISELAKEANVSLGYTSEVLRALTTQGYLDRQKRKGFQLRDKTALLDKWATVYKFSQNKSIGLYTFEKDFGSLFKKISEASSLLNSKCALTLLSAASIVAPYIARFSEIHLYIQGDIEKWKDKLDLREIESGANFYLIIPYDEGVFYGLKKEKGVPLVGNIQLYLDLIEYPARGKEQAEYLRKKLIKF